VNLPCSPEHIDGVEGAEFQHPDFPLAGPLSFNPAAFWLSMRQRLHLLFFTLC
jgi:hypothetical protein